MSDNTDQLEREARMGEQAEGVLNHPMLKTWFTSRKASLFYSFTNTNATDDEGRRLIWLKMQVVDELELDLREHVETGKMAKSTLKRIFDAMRGKR